jgi:hypothetical protein
VVDLCQVCALVAHTQEEAEELLAIKNKDLVLHHPSYLADLATCDFFLFIRIKSQLLGNDF